MSLILCAFLAAVPPDPIAEAWWLLEQGKIADAKTLIAGSRRVPEQRLRADFLSARVLMSEGRSADALALLERTPALSTAFGPWADLLAAEAHLRAGQGDKAAARIRPLLGRPSFNHSVDERCVHYLLMRDALGHVPDEPNGVEPQILLGARLAERLQLDWLPKDLHSVTVRLGGLDSRTRQLNYRLTHSPLLTLAGDLKAARAATAYTLAVFLPPPSTSPEARAALTQGLLPLLATDAGKRDIFAMVLFCTSEEAQFTAAAAELNAASPAGDLLLLRTSLRHAFSSHGVMRPPYFLLAGRDTGKGIIDWEPPWGSPHLFFARVKARLGATR